MAGAKKPKPTFKEVLRQGPTFKQINRQLKLRDDLESIAQLEEEGKVVAVLLPDPNDEIRVYVGFVEESDEDGNSTVAASVSRDRGVRVTVRFDDEGYSPWAVRFASLSLNQKLDLYRLLLKKDQFYLVWPPEPVSQDVVAYVDEQVRRLEGHDAMTDVDALWLKGHQDATMSCSRSKTWRRSCTGLSTESARCAPSATFHLRCPLAIVSTGTVPSSWPGSSHARSLTTTTTAVHLRSREHYERRRRPRA